MPPEEEPTMTHPHGLFTWTDLASPDPPAAIDFYGSVFGWEATAVGDADLGTGYTMFSIDGKNVAGMGKLSAEQQAQGWPPMWSSYVNVDDVDAVAAKAAALGADVVMPPMDIMDTGRMSYLMDPTGAALGLWQPGTHGGADLFNSHGALTWNELATRDAAAAGEFYASLLPWRLDRQDIDGFPYTMIYLNDQSNGGIYTMDDSMPAEVPAHWVVYFGNDDTDETVARVIAGGGRVVMRAADTPFGRVAAVTDLHGAGFRIISQQS
jgi:predicted enzyme related to lactoylglutathione lyase